MYTVRRAKPEDIDSIYNLIYELAVFEKAPEQLVNTKEDLLRDGFGSNPVYICFVAESEGRILGMALSYIRYSTWKGPCLYLEDLIVTETMRGNGIGKLLFETTLQYAKEKQYARVQWQVLDWNTSAIDFYKTFNASFEEGWMNAWVEMTND